ncbi:MAG: hypothetical protein AB7K24_27720 [Gemmataceae bacterium]
MNYSQRADEFIARIRSAQLNTTTDIALVFHYEDAKGQPRRQRVSITPTTILPRSDAPDARPKVNPRQLDAIIDSIEKRVRRPPESSILDGVQVKLVGIDLEIDGAI